VKRNELLTALNKREHYYLAVVIVDGESIADLQTKQDPLHGDWAFALTSQNLDL